MFKPRQAALMVIITTFAFGIATGFSASRLAIGRSSLPVNKRQKFIDEIDREISLTTAQQECLVNILAEAEPEYRALIERCQPRLTTIRKSTRERIRSLLTPSQQRLFDQRSARH